MFYFRTDSVMKIYYIIFLCFSLNLYSCLSHKLLVHISTKTAHLRFYREGKKTQIFVPILEICQINKFLHLFINRSVIKNSPKKQLYYFFILIIERGEIALQNYQKDTKCSNLSTYISITNTTPPPPSPQVV